MATLAATSTSTFNSPSVPETQLVVLSSSSPPYRTIHPAFPVPTPGPYEVLIRNIVVASNPKDWKAPLSMKGKVKGYEEGCVEGNDVAGVVVALGSHVKKDGNGIGVGDRVAALSRLFTGESKYGAYAEYTIAPLSTTFKLGPNTSYEDAAALPLSCMTAALGLFRDLCLPDPSLSPSASLSPSDIPKTPTLIINGASSSVGLYAVQLAKKIPDGDGSGCYVIGIAGKSGDTARAMGADIVLDYTKEEDMESALIDTIASLTHHASSIPIYAFDCIGGKGSAVMLSRVLSKTSGDGEGRYSTVLRISAEERKEIPEGIGLSETEVVSAYGKESEFASRFYPLISSWVDQGSLKPTKVRVVEGGLAGVDGALIEMQAGKVHAEKLVYRVEDTPGLGGR